MTHAIEVENLVKRYGPVEAVKGVSFTVEGGECFGSLGPNGAGKTTLIRILTGLVLPTSGRAKVAGLDVVREPDPVRSAIGVVSQAMTTDLDLTGRENLDIYGKYYQMSERNRREQIAYLLDLVGLTERADDLVAAYSGGMRRRLEIARGLIHKPSILFLDEPTIGLDPQSRRVVWEILQKFRKTGNLTIFLTTHYMDEADILCDRIAIVDDGRIVVLDTPENLKRNLPAGDAVELVLEEGAEAPVEALRALPYVRTVVSEEQRLRLGVDRGAEAIPQLVGFLQEKGIRVASLTLHQQSLEDVFIHYTGRSIRTEEAKKVSYLIGAGVPRRWGG
jgi:ABC-2 type transport system ATP-binding protein